MFHVSGNITSLSLERSLKEQIGTCWTLALNSMLGEGVGSTVLCYGLKKGMTYHSGLELGVLFTREKILHQRHEQFCCVVILEVWDGVNVFGLKIWCGIQGTGRTAPPKTSEQNFPLSRIQSFQQVKAVWHCNNCSLSSLFNIDSHTWKRHLFPSGLHWFAMFVSRHFLQYRWATWCFVQ